MLQWALTLSQVLALIRDIANPSALDPHFTPFRHFDWFVGHSWALGIVADANGRNQVSPLLACINNPQSPVVVITNKSNANTRF
jgi:hypothetical protein